MCEQCFPNEPRSIYAAMGDPEFDHDSDEPEVRK